MHLRQTACLPELQHTWMWKTTNQEPTMHVVHLKENELQAIQLKTHRPISTHSFCHKGGCFLAILIRNMLPSYSVEGMNQTIIAVTEKSHGVTEFRSGRDLRKYTEIVLQTKNQRFKDIKGNVHVQQAISRAKNFFLIHFYQHTVLFTTTTRFTNNLVVLEVLRDFLC